MVNVAVAQFAPGEDKPANLAAAGRLVAEAADQGARVVLLPEYAMFTAPRTDERFVAAAEPLDGAFVAGLARLASASRAVVVAGVVESAPGGERFRNTLVAVAPGGEVVALYRKLHLYDAFGVTESDVVEPGAIEEPRTFTVDGLTFGLQTCFDLRFPEVTRRIADAGAQVLLLAAEWVPGPLKEDHWTTLVRARAIENTMYVAAAGQNAPTGSGNSMIVDPMGVRLAALGEQTGIAVAHISDERLTEVRTKNPTLALRRFSVTAKQ
ncbi:carbon-nitrogen hydrolase family protein [Streptomonospora nanhaiensis]|uniref:Putative amidohydrolase n=1 Tax=Streptomonospora nanhaiensis TaxID=1323731 RepID=A0A853BTP8_9ACTN|nr:carbon-nitrogen hydrolase family protein [Streptomonospora nanhaiensis]MBV2367103.1 carbon-nitrogen hydrolase family protein [Streptomonospora nanhaiensis]MBX9386818.1 carbon-nitrogen hydrolase family protein [Streptomonospora nanhaiensis]NYI98116.1 putative amidohydrolase [Streptomonospora nanhaiensis]